MKRTAMICALSMALAWPAAAQGPVVADVHKGLFKALQAANMAKRSGTWGEAEAKPIRFAVLQDGVLDKSEKAVLTALRGGAFAFTISGIQEPTFKPKDLPLKGTMDAAGIALLNITDADLNASVNQMPGESRAAFLVRRGKEGAVELAALVESDPKARDEARALFANRFDAAIVADAKAGRSANHPALSQTLSGDLEKVDSLPAAEKEKWRRFLAEAAVLNVHQRILPIRIYAQLFGGEDQAEAQAPAIAAKLGLN